MKLCISKLYLGRYKIEMVDEDNQVQVGYDCGSAGVIVALTGFIFDEEHRQYQRDQKANSDALGQSIIEDMKHDPSKFTPPAKISNERTTSPHFRAIPHSLPPQDDKG